MKPGRVFVLSLAALVIPLVGCVSLGKHQDLQKKYDQDTQDLQATIDILKRKIGDLEKSGLISSKDLQLARLELERLAEERTRLEKELAGIPGVDVTRKGGIQMEGDYFFDPGMASIRKGAKASLDKVAEVIASREGRIVVIGHTDIDPIDKSKKMWTTGLNHELGAARAVQVMSYLVGRGISKDRFEVSSPGEFQPADPGSSKEAKKKNRRVEIFLVSVAPGK
jgi:chemotaxis protein MotB